MIVIQIWISIVQENIVCSIRVEDQVQLVVDILDGGLNNGGLQEVRQGHDAFGLVPQPIFKQSIINKFKS